MVETGERICEVQCNAPTFTVAWHPQKPLLAFACDDKVNTEAMCDKEVVILMSLVLFSLVLRCSNFQITVEYVKTIPKLSTITKDTAYLFLQKTSQDMK